MPSGLNYEEQVALWLAREETRKRKAETVMVAVAAMLPSGLFKAG